MKIKVILDTTGKIISYATVGDIIGSTEVDLPDDTDMSTVINSTVENGTIEIHSP